MRFRTARLLPNPFCPTSHEEVVSRPKYPDNDIDFLSDGKVFHLEKSSKPHLKLRKCDEIEIRALLGENPGAHRGGAKLPPLPLMEFTHDLSRSIQHKQATIAVGTGHTHCETRVVFHANG